MQVWQSVMGSDMDETGSQAIAVRNVHLCSYLQRAALVCSEPRLDVIPAAHTLAAVAALLADSSAHTEDEWPAVDDKTEYDFAASADWLLDSAAVDAEFVKVWSDDWGGGVVLGCVDGSGGEGGSDDDGLHGSDFGLNVSEERDDHSFYRVRVVYHGSDQGVEQSAGC